MAGTAFVDQLKAKFGDKIAGANFENIDPWIEVTPDGLLEVCRYLRDEPTLAFDYLNCISGVDYLHTDEKKAAKSEWQPHTEVVYHLFSMKHKHSLVLKVILPRWKNDKPGELPELPSVSGSVEHGRLARARSVRPVRRVLHRPSESAAHPVPGRLGRPSAAQRLRDAARIPRHSRKVVRSHVSNCRRSPHHRVRRPHGRDARQHGPAASEHARRAAARAADRWRNRLRSRAAHRLSASLRGKDRREPHAAAVDSVHRPDGLPGRDEHESRLVARGREADELPRARTRPASARVDLPS